MVRSKGEGGANARELFHLTERLRAADKYFDISHAEIERQLAAGGSCEVVWQHETADENGDPVGAELKLNVNCKSSVWRNWSVSLKLHGIRIDCIDHESRFDAVDGTVSTGWHRHSWDTTRRTAERLKVPLAGFGESWSSREEFLIRAFSEMRILLNSSDHGNSSLPFA